MTLASCYDRLAPSDLVTISAGPARQGIVGTEQALVDALPRKPRSIAGLVLVSGLRELETLVGVLRQVKKGIVDVEREE